MNATKVSRADHHKPACDRCRGQKLRCIWETEGTKCRRCTRAGSVCATSPRRPLGRPPTRLHSTAGVQASFDWEESRVDIGAPAHAPGSDNSIPAQRRGSVLSGISSFADDGQWSMRSASNNGMGSSSGGLASDDNSLLSSSPATSINMDLEELLDECVVGC